MKLNPTVSIGYSRSGALILAEDVLALARLERRVGGELELLDGAQARELAPLLTGELAGALWAAREAHIDTRALGAALAVAFQKAGGKLLTNEAVVRIEQRGGRAAIAHTPFGRYEADLFILAAGAWSGLLEGGNAGAGDAGQGRDDRAGAASRRGAAGAGDLGPWHLRRAARRADADRRHGGECRLRYQPDRRRARFRCARRRSA